MVNYFRLIKGYITQRKIRSLLTIIGVFIGIAAVFSLVSIGQGMQKFIDEQFQASGSNRLTVTPGGGMANSAPGSSLVSAKLYEKDVETVSKSRGVEHAAGYLLRGSVFEFNKESKNGYILAMPTDIVTISYSKQVDFMQVESGRYLNSNDKFSVIISYRTAYTEFKKPVGLGDKIKISGYDFTVVGIRKKSGNPIYDRMSLIPKEAGKEVYNSSDESSMIIVRTIDGFKPEDVAEYVTKDLRRERNVKKGEEDFTVQTAQQSIATFNSILGMVSMFLVGIASISLIVGSVGIMNSMYTSVMERTREIGIMKAIGARNSDIAMIFLIESGILGAVGGIAGIIFGTILAKGTEFVAQLYGIGLFRSYITIELVIGSLAFSFIIGALSGFFPSLEAAGLKPVEAFRYKK